MVVNKDSKSVKKYSDIMIQRKHGAIDAKYYQHDVSSFHNKSVVLILHPDPIHGGSMNNKIVKVIGNAFIELDFDVLRINFRGVGRSQGEYDKGVGEVDDALDAIDWLLDKHDNLANVWVAGFGFGGLVCMKTVMRRPNINGFIAISPPKESENLNMLTPCPNGMFIVGEHDHTVDAEFVSSLPDLLSCQKNAFIDYKCINGSDHYFSDHSEELYEELYTYVKDKMLLDITVSTKKKNKKSSKL
ncbi:alpha/beta hydrolase [Candidatus Cytomitobacter primus]|uniref:Alpha/beta hydrolase n=1 Tax=Candidatus Cytomitobacter primus TaxID=2066024 RepID=A0A5C0UFB4_9PROT|nr:alpha/beta fold hydrolase [Candidatus Cytomitobacter primus]QEK38796.1 alpha/beta hydrolase [Candidatus Cytomitobacter primus]